jgi:hypothetical protein
MPDLMLATAVFSDGAKHCNAARYYPVRNVVMEIGSAKCACFKSTNRES